MRAAHRSRATSSASGSSLAVLLATAPLGRGDGGEQRGGGVACGRVRPRRDAELLRVELMQPRRRLDRDLIQQRRGGVTRGGEGGG
eukprot:CAMPEP_0196669820 /NCGR_PEP_ID=MMETSP1090-20130531/885_1 /TAXON_ID=37098 /ORGANISM="Isochrysis sp, Strain CCMP1244" /LENGTH=85 /DNA_ID=CAMNT_0042007395 /DNA_START=255 /DNA_END=508 /DNA_ORIENTATION=+